VHNRKLKLLELEIEGNRYECQLSSWKIVNNTEDGEKFFTFCPDGEFREETDDDYSLELKFYADWRAPNGISEWLWEHDKQTVDARILHHPDIAAERVQFDQPIVIKSPDIGGEVRTTELTELTLPIIGRPTKTRP
jgi:hypothetical protein